MGETRRTVTGNSAQLRLEWPLESQTLCRSKEVVRDVMSEKGFLGVEISLDPAVLRNAA